MLTLTLLVVGGLFSTWIAAEITAITIKTIAWLVVRPTA